MQSKAVPAPESRATQPGGRQPPERGDRSARALAALNKVTAAISGSLDLDFMLAKVLDTVLEVTGMEAGYIQWLDRASRQVFLKAHKGISAETVAKLTGGGRAGGKNEQVVSTKRSIVLENMPADYGGKFGGEKIRAAAWVPARSRDNVVGILTVATRKNGTFPHETIVLLESIGATVGVAMENARLYRDVDRRRRHAEVLREVGLALTATHEPQQVLQRVAEEARQLVDALFTYVVTPDVPFFKIAAVAGDDQGYRDMLKLSDDPDSIYGRGPLGQSIRTRTPVVCEDVLTDPLFVPWRDIASARGIRSLVAVPLVGSEKTYGALLTYSPLPRAYDAETLNLLNALGAQAAAALENARLFEETEARASENARLYQTIKTTSRELEALVKVNRDVAALCDREVLLPRIAEEARRILKVDSSIFRLVEGDSLVLVSGSDHQKLSFRPKLHLHESLSGKIIQENRVLAIKNILEDSTLVESHRQVIRDAGYRSFLGIPLRVGKRVIGAFNFYSKQEREFQPEEIRLITAFADQAAVAVENANLYQQSRRREEIQTVLKELSLDITSLDIDSLLKKLTEQVRKILGVDVSDVQVLEQSLWRTIGVSGIEPERLRSKSKGTGRGRSRWIVENRKPLMTPDITRAADSAGGESLQSAGIRGYLAAPLFSRKSEVIGILRALSFEPRKFSQDDVDLLQQLANGAAIALENARLFKETEKRARELAAFQTVMSAISSSIELDEVLQSALHAVLLVTGMESGRLRLLDEGSNRLVLKAHKGISAEQLARSEAAAQPQGRSAQVLSTKRTVVAHRDTAVGAGRESRTLNEGYQAVAWIPIVSKDSAVGIINLATREPNNFLLDQIPLLESIGASLGVAIEKANLYQESKRQEETQKLLKELGQDITSLELNELFQKVADKVRDFFKVDISDIRLLGQGETIHLVAASGIESERLYVSRKVRGRTGWILKTRQPLVISDTAKDTAIQTGDTVRQLGMRGYVAVPLFSRDGAVVGVLRALTRRPREFSQSEVDLLRQLANGAAIALENATLYRESKRKEETQKLLKELSQDITSLDIEALFQKVTGKVREFFKVDICDIRLLEEGGVRRLVGSSGIESERLYKLGKSRGRSGWIVKNRKPLIVADITQETGIPTGETTREIGIRGYLAVPLFSRTWDVIGILRALSYQPREFTQAEVDLLQQLANGTAVAIENAHLFHEATAKAREISALYEVAATLNQSLELEGVLQEVIKKITEIFRFDATRIYFLDYRMDELCLRASFETSPELWPTSNTFRGGQGIVGKVMESGEPLSFENVQNDPVYQELSHSKATGKAGYSFFAAFPIKSKLRSIGALTCIGRESRKLTADDNRMLNTMTDQIGVAVDNANLFREVELRAHEQSALNSIAMEVSRFLHPDDLLRISLDKVLEVMGRERGYIRLKDSVTGALRLAAYRGISEEYVETLLHRRTPGGKSDRVFDSGEPLIINDMDGTVLKEETRREGSLSMAWIPLKARRGVVGILTVSTGRPVPFEPREVDLLLAIGNVIGVALENAQLFEESERLVRELETTAQQLGAKNRELDSFVYTVSHDLKAPLITLEGMAALLLDEYGAKLDEEARHYLNRLMAGSKQMERLILDLLALSRIGREGRSPETVDLNQMVDEFLLEWGEIIKSKKIRVTRRELPAVRGVRIQISQVMTNLVSNAIKYIGDSSDPVIEIGAENGDGKMVECYVKDNGIGIDPEYHEKIFETFQRLKDIETEGTGVGLAIVKKIVEAAGGRVWVESAKGEGATFRFTWPKREEPEVKP